MVGANWYVDDERIMTEQAASRAKELAQWITLGIELDEEPDDRELFSAMHTCAYRAVRARRADGRDEWVRRWETIRERIVERNIGLVYSMISRFSSKRLDQDDMISEAMYAYSRAVDRFNPWKGYQFSTYACNVIARALMRRGEHETKYRERLGVQHELAFERAEATGDESADLYLERLNRVLARNLGGLTDLESDVLRHRFPQDPSDRLTFREIGKKVGMSKERVRQAQGRALSKLRQALDMDPILQ